MYAIKRHICLIILILTIGIGHAQERSTEVALYFRVGDSIIDPYYVGNGFQLENIENFLNEISNDSSQELVSVYITGSASPEGGDNLNRLLAKNRANGLKEFVLSVANIPESMICRDAENYIPWDYLKELVINSNIPNKETILTILRGGEFPHIIVNTTSG